MDLPKACALMIEKELETGFKFEITSLDSKPMLRCKNVRRNDSCYGMQFQVYLGVLEFLNFGDTMDFMVKQLENKQRTEVNPKLKAWEPGE